MSTTASTYSDNPWAVKKKKDAEGGFSDEPEQPRAASPEQSRYNNNHRRQQQHHDSDEDDDDDHHHHSYRQSSGRSFCCIITYVGLFVCIILSLAFVGIVVWYFIDDDEPRPVAKCGDCHCITLGDTIETCPAVAPASEFPIDYIVALQKQQPLNDFAASQCDPWTDSGCQPPETGFDETTAVCGLHYTDRECSKYRLKSYQTRTEAEAAGAFVTHVGACGLCSSTQDLAVLMEIVDLTTVTEKCGAKTSKSNGQDCFEGLGFSEACAKLWAERARHNGRHCALACQTADLRDTPFNGNAPTCALNSCLACEEDKTAQKFWLYGGRTKRSSGLLSAVARPCSQIADIKQEVCPTTKPLV